MEGGEHPAGGGGEGELPQPTDDMEGIAGGEEGEEVQAAEPQHAEQAQQQVAEELEGTAVSVPPGGCGVGGWQACAARCRPGSVEGRQQFVVPQDIHA